MEKGMEEPYIEGVAIHDGPESCVGVREGGGEALTGVHVGRAIEPRNHYLRGADAVVGAEGHTDVSASRELPAGPARSENLGMRGISMHENREIPSLSVRLITGRAAWGRLRPYA
jgi:NADPH-dependent curcumin reductase CurA